MALSGDVAYTEPQLTISLQAKSARILRSSTQVLGGTRAFRLPWLGPRGQAVSWLPGPAHPHTSPSCSLKNVTYWGPPSCSLHLILCPTLITHPAFILYKYICVYNYIYIFFVGVWVLFLPRPWHPSPLCVCVCDDDAVGGGLCLELKVCIGSPHLFLLYEPPDWGERVMPS